jgi:hypothetical protein
VQPLFTKCIGAGKGFTQINLVRQKELRAEFDQAYAEKSFLQTKRTTYGIPQPVTFIINI